MKRQHFLGFEPLSNEEQETLFAGNGWVAALPAVSSLISTVNSGLTSLSNFGEKISDNIIKQKIVSKIDSVQKGEIQIDKDGGMKLKWDSSTPNGINTIIF